MSAPSQHIVCSHCNATNRLPVERLQDAPKCGKCGQALLTGQVQELTDMNIAKVAQKNDVLTIVDFWASWCQPCLMMAPQFKEAASQMPTVVFAKMQTDRYEQAAAPFNIRSLPTMVAFRSGQVIARQSGALSAAQIMQWVRSLPA